MKALALILSLSITILASNANAIVKPVGTFVPHQCGEQVEGAEELGMQSASALRVVCVGEVIGETDSAVQFRFDNGEERIFNVTHKASLLVALRSGNIKMVYYLQSKEGDQTMMRVLQSRDGVVKSVSGKVNEIPYVVPQLETMFTIQGVE